MLPHIEGTVINQSLKIEIVEIKNSSQQNGRYMLPFFFRESLHNTTIKGSLPYNEYEHFFLNSNFIFNFVSMYFNHVNYV
jgi:hypothetical protein